MCKVRRPIRKNREGAAERIAAWAKAETTSDRWGVTYFSCLPCVLMSYHFPILGSRKPIGHDSEQVYFHAEVVEHVFWLGSRRSLDLGYHNHNTSNLYLRSPAQCQGDLCGTNERHVARSLLEVIGGRGEGRKEGPDSRCQAAESNTWWHGARRKASVLVKLRSSRRCVSVKLGLSSRSLGSIVSRPRLSP